jgi:hypothetical protein
MKIKSLLLGWMLLAASTLEAADAQQADSALQKEARRALNGQNILKETEKDKLTDSTLQKEGQHIVKEAGSDKLADSVLQKDVSAKRAPKKEKIVLNGEDVDVVEEASAKRAPKKENIALKGEDVDVVEEASAKRTLKEDNTEWTENELSNLTFKRKGGVVINEQATSITTGGDMFSGYTRAIPYDRMIPPYGLEVTLDKTVHIIFPAPIRYVDLGNERLLAGKAGEAENVLRVKSAEERWEGETNMSVITDNGSFYTFNVKFADEPAKLNVEMHDFVHDGSAVNRPNNSMEIYLKELNSESPRLVRLIMKSIHGNNYRIIKHIGA